MAFLSADELGGGEEEKWVAKCMSRLSPDAPLEIMFVRFNWMESRHCASIFLRLIDGGGGRFMKNQLRSTQANFPNENLQVSPNSVAPLYAPLELQIQEKLSPSLSGSLRLWSRP